MLFVHLIFLLLPTAILANWPESWIVAETCNTASTFSYDNCTSSDVLCLCKNKNFLATVAYCIATFAGSSQNRDKAWDHFMSANCKQHDIGISDQSYYDAITHLQNSTAVPGPSSPPAEHSWGGGTVYTSPVRINEGLYRDDENSVRNFLHQKDISEWQGVILVGYWFLIMVVFGLGRLFKYLSIRFTGQYSSMTRSSRLTRFMQRNITIPALFGYKHMTKVRILWINLTLPTRLETIFIFIYFALNVVFDVVPYTFINDDTMYPTQYKEMLRFVSDRSGIIGVIQLPLLTLFALRNNILIWVTGWSYSTFNTYHRAITRVTYAQFIVHSVVKHIFSESYHGSLVKYFYPMPYYRWGVSAMFLMAIMIGSGIFRMNHYELFLRLHSSCGIAAYICILYHMRGLGYKQTVYVSFGLWAADYLLRIIRITFFNFAIVFSPVTNKKTSFAELCILTGDIVNVRVRATVLWKPKPGEYVFIYFNRKIWEAHPFSVVGPSSDGESFQLLCKARGGMTRRFIKKLKEQGCDKDHAIVKPVLIEGPYGLHCPVERYSEVLLVAGGVGITGVIPYVEYLTHSPEANPTRILFIWAVQARSDTRWIEERLLNLSNKVEIVVYSATPDSGNQEVKGFAYSPKDGDSIPDDDNTSIISSNYAEDEKPRGRKKAQPTTPYDSQPYGRSLTLKPTGSSQKTRYNEKQSDLGANPYIESDSPVSSSIQPQTAKMYPSMLTLNSDTASKTPYKSHRRRLSKMEWYKQIKDGRADLPSIIKEFFMGSSGSSCVLGCGPPPMMDTIRQSVTRYLDMNENGRVDYFEEAYSW